MALRRAVEGYTVRRSGSRALDRGRQLFVVHLSDYSKRSAYPHRPWGSADGRTLSPIHQGRDRSQTTEAIPSILLMTQLRATHRHVVKPGETTRNWGIVASKVALRRNFMKSIFLGVCLLLGTAGTLAEEVLNGIWFSYNQQRGSKQRYVISDSHLETADFLQESQQSITGDDASDSGAENAQRMEIVARDDDALYYRDPDGFLYALLFFPSTGSGYRYQIMTIGGLEDLDELKAQADFEFLPVDSFFTDPVFREDEAATLERQKTFAQISREQLISLLENRKKHGALLQELLEENPEMGDSPSELFRMTHSLFLKDAIHMGLNPYAIMDEDPFARFQNDPVIQQLLDTLY
ncbi:MAG: hypothetical protein AAGI88_08680 [Pseudomonadota bacterium]